VPIDWETAVGAPLMQIFGEPATYTPEIGVPVDVIGIFDKAYKDELAILDSSVGNTTETPVLGVTKGQFPARPRQGARVYVASVDTTYVVKEVRDDGHAIYKLMLNKVFTP
jgi:hypothetical protein